MEEDQDVDHPTWHYDKDVPPSGSYGNPTHTPDVWPDGYLTGLYRIHVGVPLPQLLTDTQTTKATALPSIWTLFCRHCGHEAWNPLLDFQVPEFWTFCSEYLSIIAAGCNPFPEPPQSTKPPQVTTQPAAQSEHRPGSIALFPLNRAPLQPPISTINNPTMTAPPVAPSSPLPWSIMGQGNKLHSFAAAARNTNKPKPSNPPPIQTTNQPTDLTNSQLDNMTCDQLVTAYETRFKACVTTCNVTFLGLRRVYFSFSTCLLSLSHHVTNHPSISIT